MPAYKNSQTADIYDIIDHRPDRNSYPNGDAYETAMFDWQYELNQKVNYSKATKGLRDIDPEGKLYMTYLESGETSRANLLIQENGVPPRKVDEMNKRHDTANGAEAKPAEAAPARQTAEQVRAWAEDPKVPLQYLRQYANPPQLLQAMEDILPTVGDPAQKQAFEKLSQAATGLKRNYSDEQWQQIQNLREDAAYISHGKPPKDRTPQPVPEAKPETQKQTTPAEAMNRINQLAKDPNSPGPTLTETLHDMPEGLRQQIFNNAGMQRQFVAMMMRPENAHLSEQFAAIVSQRECPDSLKQTLGKQSPSGQSALKQAMLEAPTREVFEKIETARSRDPHLFGNPMHDADFALKIASKPQIGPYYLKSALTQQQKVDLLHTAVETGNGPAALAISDAARFAGTPIPLSEDAQSLIREARAHPPVQQQRQQQQQQQQGGGSSDPAHEARRQQTLELQQLQMQEQAVRQQQMRAQYEALNGPSQQPQPQLTQQAGSGSPNQTTQQTPTTGDTPPKPPENTGKPSASPAAGGMSTANAAVGVGMGVWGLAQKFGDDASSFYRDWQAGGLRAAAAGTGVFADVANLAVGLGEVAVGIKNLVKPVAAAVEGAGGVLGKIAGKIAIPIALVSGAVDAVGGWLEHNGHRVMQAVGGTAGGVLGGIAASTLAGLAMGSFVPGAGNLVGAAVGFGAGVVGAIGGAMGLGKVFDDVWGNDLDAMLKEGDAKAPASKAAGVSKSPAQSPAQTQPAIQQEREIIQAKVKDLALNHPEMEDIRSQYSIAA